MDSAVSSVSGGKFGSMCFAAQAGRSLYRPLYLRPGPALRDVPPQRCAALPRLISQCVIEVPIVVARTKYIPQVHVFGADASTVCEAAL